jgi:lambda repressor-like predicted transcriptional regulator
MKDNRQNIIKGRAQMKGLSVADLARKTGISESTLYRKLKFPGGINLAELEIIDELVEFTDEEILYFVRWRRCGK